MAEAYTASARRNPGGKFWLVEFRHPLRTDNSGRYGRKTRKGLGTDDEATAQNYVAQLNEILQDQSLWSLGAKPEAEKRYGNSPVVDIFYSEIEPRNRNARLLRDKYLPLPDSTSGYVRVLLLGVPGAGKTTILRHLIGSKPDQDRFPSTSVNRTTTFPAEVVTREGGFHAVVTFLSEHEARFEVEECVSSAILKAVEQDRSKTAAAFLEKSDMRFRLKYLLGDLTTDSEDDEDPYLDDACEQLDDTPAVSTSESMRLLERLNGFVDQIHAMAREHGKQVTASFGALTQMTPEDKSAALDLIQSSAEDSDEFTSLVSDVMDELHKKFEAVRTGDFIKSTTGWPVAWQLESPVSKRADFFAAVRFFSGISKPSWGKLLTPLVNGIRVAGPLAPSKNWWETPPRLVMMDTEGLGHKANASADLPDHLVALFEEANCILLVDSAKNAMTHFAAGKALEAVVNSGQTRKLLVAFTHMDAASDRNFRGKAVKDHVFGGLRNVTENQVAKTISVDAARYLMEHLERETYFLGKLDQADPIAAQKELHRLLTRIHDCIPATFVPIAFPEYGEDKLAFAIQEAARDFRRPWRAWLGLESLAEHRPYPWQSIKAMTRRYAEGWDDGYSLHPTSNLLGALQRAISRFLETPLDWSGAPSEEQKREIIDQIKALVAVEFRALSQQRLRERPQPQWQSAFALKGKGTTNDRRLQVEAIFERSVPIPHAAGDRETQEFLDDVKKTVLGAITRVEEMARNLKRA